MSARFYALARFQMALPGDVDGIAGGVILPSGISAFTLGRRALEKRYPYLSKRLLDPQLYLHELDAATANKVCARLYSYPWFQAPGARQFDSGKYTQAEWRVHLEKEVRTRWEALDLNRASGRNRAIAEAIRFQAGLGCEALILPAPMIGDPAAMLDSYWVWIDEGLEVARKEFPGMEQLASVVISDTCLRGNDPWKSSLLDEIVDQVTARQVDGAYIVLEQANENGYYICDEYTIGALLRLSCDLKAGGIKTVHVAMSGIAGFLAVLAGADCWSAGWYRGERRFRLVDLEDQEGRATPTFYSHPLAGDIHLENDLDKLVAAGHLPRLRDTTSASEGLMSALAAGGKVVKVAAWRHGQGNLTAAREHFLLACVRETRRVASLDLAARRVHGLGWIDGAQQLATECFASAPFNPRTSLDHQRSWYRAFRKLVRARPI